MSTEEIEEQNEPQARQEIEDLDDKECLGLLEFLRHNRGFDFRGYKRGSLIRRLRKRMQTVGVATCPEYIDYLEVHPDEFAQLFNTILINVTSFFRDPEAWHALDAQVLPRIINARGGSGPIRIWSAGCASGEEPYTLMMLLAERMGIDAARERVKIYATDADEEALQEARMAVYSERAVHPVPEQMLAKYFKASGAGYVFNGDLRRNVIFGQHNLINDAPISRIDLLICRNTMMYFNAELQTRILSRFYFALNASGSLMMGKPEMLFTHSNLFTPIDLKHRIFAKVPREIMRDRVMLMMNGDHNQGEDDSEEAAPFMRLGHWRAVFDAAPGAQLIVDRTGRLVMVNDKARQLFRLGDKDIGRPYVDVDVSYRPVELKPLVDQVYRELRPISVKNAPYTTTVNRKVEIGYLDVEIVPVMDQSRAVGVVITFTDSTRFKQLQDELEESNRELETAYEELQSTNEELETTNEELQATIEELETTNEELQSTNEELETMNEELQSANEELQAINEELRQRSGDLNSANTFMASVLSNLRAAVVVLDADMHVQVWNGKAEDLWGLRADETVGRHLLTLDIGLPTEPLKAPIRSAVMGESLSSEVTLDATNRRGKSIQCKVSITELPGMYDGRRGALLLMEPA